jgi:polar amino acid transport system substrate-binding protein
MLPGGMVVRLAARPWLHDHGGRKLFRLRERAILTALCVVLGLGGLAGACAAAEQAAEPQPPAPAFEPRTLRGGWYPWDPYQYREYQHSGAVLTGFDVEIERALARVLGVDLVLRPMAWEDHLAAVAAGTADIAAGATYSAERDRYAYFSKPYRQETEVLILPKGAGSRYHFTSVEGMLQAFATQPFRLGVVAGFTYARPDVNAFVADPERQAQIVRVGDEAENLQNLLAGRIDGFIADRIVAATVAWRVRKSAAIEEYPLIFSTNIHFMLSRASQTPAMLARLDEAIDQIKQSGEFQHIADSYALPILIHQTLDSGWFEALAFLGTVAFALSGVVLAYAGNYSLFGALVLVSLPALGGGVVRDLVVQRQPLGIVRDPGSLLTVFITVILGMVFFKLMSLTGTQRLAKSLQARQRLGANLIQICDALGLAAFLVVGVVVVLDAAVEPLWLWGPISAGITSSFGSLMRDLLRQDRESVSLKGELYPEIAVAWGLAFSLFLGWEAERLQPQEIWLGVVVTIAGAFLTRMLAIAFRLKGIPYA